MLTPPTTDEMNQGFLLQVAGCALVADVRAAHELLTGQSQGVDDLLLHDEVTPVEFAVSVSTGERLDSWRLPIFLARRHASAISSPAAIYVLNSSGSQKPEAEAI